MDPERFNWVSGRARVRRLPMEGDRVLQGSLPSSGERMDSLCSVPKMVEGVMVTLLH